MKICSVIGCDQKVAALGMCQSHYGKYKYTLNKEKEKADDRAYYRNNREKVLRRQKAYGLLHREEQKKRSRAHYLKNKAQIKEKAKLRAVARRKEDPVFRLRRNVSAAVLQLLKKRASSKAGNSVLTYLPYSIQELKEHLEKQFEHWMTWNNYGKYNAKTWDDNNIHTWVWNVDHIIPQSKLPYKSMDDENFQKCWALVNIRPLSAKRNFLDRSR